MCINMEKCVFSAGILETMYIALLINVILSDSDNEVAWRCPILRLKLSALTLRFSM
jgi:hypothetical protein